MKGQRADRRAPLANPNFPGDTDLAYIGKIPVLAGMSFRRFRLASVLAAACVLPSLLHACLWDQDTLAMENTRFPDAQNLIAGNFPRHSREFYEWRIRQVKAHLETLPESDPRGPALRDDLAVALHKTGRHAEAIQVMEASLKTAPDRYETLSNLGTFTIYAGDLSASRAWLQKALAINPDAHFGREKYQLWLVEQLMMRAGADAFPDFLKDRHAFDVELMRGNYATYVACSQRKGMPFLNEEQTAAALRGVSGMMRFADYDNPVLLEALGDLLMGGGPGRDAGYLAHMAYGTAVERTRNDVDRPRLVEKSKRALYASQDSELKQANQALEAARKLGAALNASVRTDELRWIAEGGDVGREFEAKYLKPAEGGEDFKVVYPARK